MMINRRTPPLSDLLAEAVRLDEEFTRLWDTIDEEEDVEDDEAINAAAKRIDDVMGAMYEAPLVTLSDAAALLRATILWGGREMSPDDAAQVERAAAFLEAQEVNPATTVEPTIADRELLWWAMLHACDGCFFTDSDTVVHLELSAGAPALLVPVIAGETITPDTESPLWTAAAECLRAAWREAMNPTP